MDHKQMKSVLRAESVAFLRFGLSYIRGVIRQSALWLKVMGMILFIVPQKIP
jgi:hypothetical protein